MGIEGTVVGWIGTGVMGLSMCGRLMDAGCRAVVYSRTRAKAEPLLARGAEWAESPRAAAERADVLFTMVGFPQDVRDVYLKEAQGALAGVRPGALLVDMTTAAPSLAQDIAASARERDAHFVDAPVSGGDVGARNGALSIMIGGETAAVERAMPYFRVLGKNIVRHGPAGSGQHAKMCNQVVIASTMIGVCEALAYGSRAGLDLEAVLRSIGAGAAGCWTLDNLAPRILKRDFEPGFFVVHFVKDMGIALEEASRMDLNLPGLALAKRLYDALMARGGAERGTQALALVYEDLASGKIQAP